MTKIEWTEKTWNPVVGCSIVSPGCTNCYAMKMAARIERMGGAPQYDGTTKPSRAGAVWTGKVSLAEKALLEPLKRKKPTMYFVNSMGDLFHEDVPDDWIDRVFAVMALCPQHTFQVLTKRSARMLTYMAHVNAHGKTRHEIVQRAALSIYDVADEWMTEVWPLPNVWLGVSAEDQTRADERIPDLLETPAAVRFVSAEPLLGPIDLEHILSPENWGANPEGWRFDALTTGDCYTLHDNGTSISGDGPMRDSKIDWVIVGGESGKGARPMHPDWARSLRDQCAEAGVAFFFKQWGEWVQADNNACPNSDMTTNSAFWLDWSGEKHKPSSNGLDRPIGVIRVGKKAAGRTLDGCTHDKMPDRGSAA